mgnify:CR=1 FL=1
MKTLILAAIMGVAISTTGAVSAKANPLHDLARTGSIVTVHGILDAR